MFRTGRRWTLVILSAVVPLITLIVSIYFKLYAQTLNWWILIGFGAVSFLLAGAIAYFTHIKPVRDMTPLIQLFLEGVGQRILEAGKSEGLELRLSILRIYRPVWTLCLRRYFHVCWSMNMHQQADNDMRFHIRKGVSGQVRKSGKSLLVDMTLPENRHMGFSAKEAARFPAFTVIWSLPVFELNRSNRTTSRVLGVVNVDSATTGAYAKLRSNPGLDSLFKDFREVVSKVMS
ncbi:MAG: hypothetical protein HYX26_01690 [Acidobacteriales bacterium]|nr:hypothetical protein [Terriglobales bacterium]